MGIGRIAARAALAFACACACTAMQPLLAADAVRHVEGLVYAVADGLPLALDLHLPAGNTPAPLVVYLHGGAWSAGNRAGYPAFLVEQGFAVASVDFRSTDIAPFPANVHDIKAAVRWLRANASRHGYRGARIAISGASSGGHLAALVGVTNGAAALEGRLGEFTAESSRVDAIVSWFGASNLTTILAQSTPFGVGVREPALRRLLGALPGERRDLARLASPVFHVDDGDPPLLLLHGDQDPQMPINQLHELQGAYEQAGLRVEALVLHGVGHDATPFFEGRPAATVGAFLRPLL
jgi:acetyl esterase/lipase